MKISGFVLTTNCIERQYPFIESILSFLQICDEIIVIDGGSTDGTIDAIEKIGDKRIKIINDKETKWEDEWYYSRMGKNFNRGLEEASGDWVIKFDSDYILHENGVPKIRKEFEKVIDEKLTIDFTRLNFVLADRYFVKSKKTLAINKYKIMKKDKLPLKYGMDLKKWGWGYDFVIPMFEENGIWFGDFIRRRSNSVITSCLVHNYDNIFCEKEVVKEVRTRHYKAVRLQKGMKYNKAEVAIDNEKCDVPWRIYIDYCKNNIKKSNNLIELEKHPKIIQERIKKINKNFQGYNLWGNSVKSKYYE